MSDSSRPEPPSPTTRRASFAPGQTLTELFGGRSPPAGSGGSFAPGGPITAAAANAQAHQRRRMSVSSLGLSGTSPTQGTAPFAPRPRQSSQSSSDESAIDESGDAHPSSGGGPSFHRRLSFGARAMRDVRGGSNAGLFGGNQNGEGFNWSDAMRSRAERSTSMSTTSPTASHFRSNTYGGPPKSAAAAAPTEPAPAPAPLPKTPASPRAPDHFQERILKGDFYMD